MEQAQNATQVSQPLPVSAPIKKLTDKLPQPVMFVPGRQKITAVYGYVGTKLKMLKLPCECHTVGELANAEGVLETYVNDEGKNNLHSGNYVERIEGLEEIGRWKGENKALNTVLFRSIMGSTHKQPVTEVADVAPKK